ncbi:MAG: SlyX family protein [Gammaproteobacteria bacterium]|jgi:SlyX protein|nr:SlyX family protein [Gammaproteobacteria bacterium]MBT5054347.1 SlyX family protein [Gammaproteobacteria bacterium]
MNEDQVDRLEMKIAFQEDLLQKLDDAVVVQQQQILLLEDQVRVLSEQLQQIATTRSDAMSVVDEPPPHY